MLRFRIDLPEARDSCRRNFAASAEKMLERDVMVESQLCSGSQTDGDLGIARSRKSTSDGVRKAGGNELVAHLGGARDHVFKTVVAHQRYSVTVTPTWVCTGTSEGS